MGILKVIDKAYDNVDAVENLIFYIAERSEISGGWGISMESPESIVAEFKAVKRFWNKSGGRQVKHFIFSWDGKCWLELPQIQYMAASLTLFFQPRFQVFWGVHLDTDNPHIHFAVNTVSFADGKMLSFGLGDWIEFCQFKDMLLEEIRRKYRLKNRI